MLSSLGAQSPQPSGFGPGGMGGAAMADFDTLIELITSTIAPDTWDEVGGAGAIEPFPVNLSLVISQTQEVHEQIADLLDQLRRLQDLQVTIEVRFITLSDNFFERMGVDFDFSIDDNVDVDLISGSERTGGLGDDHGSECRHRPDDRRSHSNARPGIHPGKFRRNAATVRQLRSGHGRQLRLRHPQRPGSLLPAAGRRRRSTHQRAAGTEGHVVQRPDGHASRTSRSGRS